MWVPFIVRPNDYIPIASYTREGSHIAEPGFYIRKENEIDLRTRFKNYAQTKMVCKKLNDKDKLNAEFRVGV